MNKLQDLNFFFGVDEILADKGNLPVLFRLELSEAGIIATRLINLEFSNTTIIHFRKFKRSTVDMYTVSSVPEDLC